MLPGIHNITTFQRSNITTSESFFQKKLRRNKKNATFAVLKRAVS